MKNAEKIQEQINAVEDAQEKKFYQAIFDLEKQNNIDLANNELLANLYPISVGKALGIDRDKASILYQQYRSMKALINKQGLEAAIDRALSEPEFMGKVAKVMELDEQEQLHKIFEEK